MMCTCGQTNFLNIFGEKKNVLGFKLRTIHYYLVGENFMVVIYMANKQCKSRNVNKISTAAILERKTAVINSINIY